MNVAQILESLVSAGQVQNITLFAPRQDAEGRFTESSCAASVQFFISEKDKDAWDILKAAVREMGCSCVGNTPQGRKSISAKDFKAQTQAAVAQFSAAKGHESPLD